MAFIISMNIEYEKFTERNMHSTYSTYKNTLTFDAMKINGNYHSTKINNQTKHFQ